MIKFLEERPDDRIYELGYRKVNEDIYGVEYEKPEEMPFGTVYIHKVSIFKKSNGEYIIHSYDLEQFDTGIAGNVCVGLTTDEMEAFYAKMKEMETGQNLFETHC